MDNTRMYSIKNALFVVLTALALTSCKDKVYEIPTAKSGLQTDIIKRSLGPNIVGTNIEFVFAAAILPEEGRLAELSVEASIVGDAGSLLEHRSFHTNGSGTDVAVVVGEPATQEGNKTKVLITKDTAAVALRYYYKIPEEARGKRVSFKFSAKTKDGKTSSYDMGPFEIRKMDMSLDLVATDGQKAYISIEDLKAYTAAEAATMPQKIDLIYLYRALTNVTFGHALVAPSADPIYLPGINLPAAMNNRSKLVKAWTIRDQQLARLQYGVFVDDIDLSEKTFELAPDFAINVRNEAGVWVETADGRYKAYIYINAIDPTGKKITLSIKRLKIK